MAKQNALQAAAERAKEIHGGKAPPNLKEAHECGDCKYYEGPQTGDGHCTMYDYPVSDEEVCDSWTAGAAGSSRAWAKHRRNMARG